MLVVRGLSKGLGRKLKLGAKRYACEFGDRLFAGRLEVVRVFSIEMRVDLAAWVFASLEGPPIEVHPQCPDERILFVVKDDEGDD